MSHSNQPAAIPGAYYSLAEAAERIRSIRGGARIDPATLSSWIFEGIRLRDGSIVRLEAKRLCDHWTVSDCAIDRFTTALGKDDLAGLRDWQGRAAPRGRKP
jgi:hypothetical protein